MRRINPNSAAEMRCFPASAALGSDTAVSIVNPPEMSIKRRITPEKLRIYGRKVEIIPFKVVRFGLVKPMPCALNSETIFENFRLCK